LSTPAHLVSGSTYMLGVGHLDLSTSLPPFGWDYTLGNKYTPGASVDGFLSADADYVFSTFATTPSGIVDSIPPVITVPSDQTVSATSTSGAIVTYTTPTATDNVDGPITPTCDHNSGDAFPIGTTTVTCTATDSAGNHSTKSFSIVVVDNPPVITVPSDQTVSATSTSGAIVTYTTPTATDNVDGPITPTCDHNSGDAFPIGTTTVTCTATDSAGNHSTKSFSIVVVDNPPVITVPSDQTVSATSTSGAIVTYTTPTATDNV